MIDTTVVPATVCPIDVHSYMDSAHFNLLRRLTFAQQREIQPKSGERVYISRLVEHWEDGVRYQYQKRTLTLHRLTPAVLQRLLDVAPDCQLAGVDYSWDHIYETKEAATTMKSYLDEVMFKKYPGKQEIKFVEDTTYLCQEKAPVNLAVYADKPCRFSGRPCVHFEWRLWGKQSLQRNGISDFADLFSFDSQKLFDKYLRYYEMSEKSFMRIGRVASGKTNERKWKPVIKYFGHSILYNRFFRAGHLFLRLHLATEYSQGSSHYDDVRDIISFMKKYDPNFKKYLHNPFEFDGGLDDVLLAV